MTRQIGRYPAQIIIQPEVVDLTTIISGLATALLNPETFVINRQDQLNQPVEVNIQEMWEPNLTQASSAPSSETKGGLTANAKVMLATDKFKVFAKSFNAAVIPETAETVTEVTSTGTTATVTNSLAHGYSKSDTVAIAGATPAGYNGNIIVTSVPSPSTFTYTVVSGLATPATGTITAQSPEHGLMVLSDDAGLTFGTPELPFYTVLIRPFIGANPSQNPELYVIFPRAGVKGDASLKYSLGEQWGYSLSITGYPDPETGKNKVLRGNTALLV